MAGLLGHTDLNRHLHIMGLHQDSVCPSVRRKRTQLPTSLLSALMLLQKNTLGDYILLSETLSNIHWFLLLKFVNASKRFY